MRLHHVGWAVHSCESNRHYFEHVLGLGFEDDEELLGVKVAFYSAGTTLIELVEPVDPEEIPIRTFLAENGEGIHHLAYQVDDVQVALDEAKSKGQEVLDEVPRPGARNSLIGFVDPRRPDGILVEYVQE